MKAVKSTAAARIESEREASEDVKIRIARALELQDEIDTAKRELDDIKEFFKDLLSEKSTEQRLATSVGVAILKTTNSYSVATEMVPELKKKLGELYETMVNEKVSYGCTAFMREKLSDGDYKHANLIRKATIIKTAYSVVFEGVKAAKSSVKAKKVT